MYKSLVAAIVIAGSAGWSQAQTPAEEYGPPTTDLNVPQNPGQSHSGFLGAMDSISQFKKPNLKWGLLSLNPYYGIGGTYDTNIFLQPTSHVKGQTANNNKAGPVLGSWITDNNFGLKTKLPFNEIMQLMVVGMTVQKDGPIEYEIDQESGGRDGGDRSDAVELCAEIDRFR